MSESTLSLTYDDILGQMAYEPAGWGYDSTNWSANQLAQLQRSMLNGLRDFYTAFDWSFLYPKSTLTIWPTKTGTAVGTPSTTLTAAAAMFYPSMVGKTATVGSNNYVISGYTSSTVVTLATDASGEGATPSITVTADGNYRLPDNFAYLVGKFTYATQETILGTSIRLINEEEIRRRRQVATYTGRPLDCAIRAESHDGTSGQRFELLVFPLTDAVYTWSYCYAILPDVITASTPYPYGGGQFSSAIIASCRAALEFDLNGMPGPHAADRDRKIAQAVQIESRRRADTLGYNANGPSNMGAYDVPMGRYTGSFKLNGTEI